MIRATLVRVSTFFLGVVGNWNFLLDSNSHGVTLLAHGSVHSFGMSVIGGHNEHSDSDQNEQDSSDKLGPEGRDNE